MTDLAQSNCIEHEDIQLAGAPQAVWPLKPWDMLKQLLLPIVVLSAFVGARMQPQFGNIRKQRVQFQQPEQGRDYDHYLFTCTLTPSVTASLVVRLRASSML